MGSARVSGRSQGHAGRRGVRWGPPVSLVHPFLGLFPGAHSPRLRPRPKPGESRGSMLRGDSPPQGALRFSGRTRPFRLSRAGGESGGDGSGATGCRGLRPLDGGQSGEEQARPNSCYPWRLQGSPPPPGQSPASRCRGLSERLSGGSGGSVGAAVGSHPGTPQTTAQGQAHPVLSELWQLRVLGRNV